MKKIAACGLLFIWSLEIDRQKDYNGLEVNG
jgi:hypothetical protein